MSAARKPYPKSTNANDVVVGRNVRVRRLAAGLSQSALARRLGVTFQQVQKYEKGANRIPSGRLVRIAAVLKLPVMALFEGIDAGPPTDEASPLRLIADRRSYRLAQAFAAIDDPATRLATIDLVERLAGAISRRRRRTGGR